MANWGKSSNIGTSSRRRPEALTPPQSMESLGVFRSGDEVRERVFAVMFRSLELMAGASLSLSESMSIMSASESSG